MTICDTKCPQCGTLKTEKAQLCRVCAKARRDMLARERRVKDQNHRREERESRPAKKRERVKTQAGDGIQFDTIGYLTPAIKRVILSAYERGGEYEKAEIKRCNPDIDFPA